jgi:transposase IS200 family protein
MLSELAKWYLDCDAGPRAEHLSASSLKKPRSGARMQPTAQAVGTAVKNASPKKGRKSMSHTSGNILLHFIFSTQGRRPLIKTAFRDDLFAYHGGIVREMRDTALIINGTADHVHMHVRVCPVHSAAEIVRVIKANSSKWMHTK